MEYSLPTETVDLETFVKSFTQKPAKESVTSSSVNQQLREAIERYINFSNLSSPSNLAVSNTNFPSTSTLCQRDNATNHSESAIVEDDVSETKAKGARQIYCSECPRILLSRKNFIKHAEDKHGMILPILRKSFDNQQQFNKWMAYLRDERKTEFVSKCGRKRLSNGTVLGYLVCSKTCGGDVTNRKKTTKSLKTCAAYLKVLCNENNGRIDIEGCIEHTGHELFLTSWANEGSVSSGEDVIDSPTKEFTADVVISDKRITEILDSEKCPTSNLIDSNIVTSVEEILPEKNINPAETLLSFLSLLKQTALTNSFIPHKRSKFVKQEDSNDNIPSSSNEVLRDPEVFASRIILPNSNASSDLEKRKSAMIEKILDLIQRIDSRVIESAELAMRFFLRELDGLINKS